MTLRPDDNRSQPDISHFHPDFSIPSFDDIILQSDDNTSFFFSLPLLVQISSFFRDISTLEIDKTITHDFDHLIINDETKELDHVSQSSRAHLDKTLEAQEYDDKRVIALPSATTIGLATALKILKSAISGTSTQDFSVSIESFGLTELGEAIKVADAYDVPLLSHLILNLPDRCNPATHFVRFAIASSVHLEHIALDTSRYLIGYSVTDIPAEVEQYMRTHNPDYLVRLREFLFTSTESWIQLKFALQHARHVPGGFTKACLKKGGCDSFQDYESHNTMRSRFIDTMIRLVESQKPRGDVNKAQDVALAVHVRCLQCAHRFRHMTKEAISYYRDNGRKSI